MDNTVKQAIEQGFNEFREKHITEFYNEPIWCAGWKDGVEWILTELVINKKISKEDLKKYMNKIK